MTASIPEGRPLRAAWILLALLPAISGAEPLRVAVISDLNGAYGETRYEPAVNKAMNRIVAMQPDLVISTGDMVAGQRRPHLQRPELEAMWKSFHATVTAPLAAAGIALAVTAGNHDASGYPGFELERVVFAEQWRDRRPEVAFLDAESYPFRYAFSVGDTLFVSLDATTVGPLGAAQTQWLRNVLARHGQRYRYRVVFGHLPLWPLAQGRETEYIGDPALQTLLKGAGVDLVLSGHHHAFYPGSKNGVAFVGQGCLGAGPRPLLGSLRRSSRSITWLTLTGEHIAAAAYAGPAFATPIAWESLPERVPAAGGALERADLAGTLLEFGEDN
ncbi:MAG: metallophosphoesterase family protein [Gammaproteobacteria bacterium]